MFFHLFSSRTNYHGERIFSLCFSRAVVRNRKILNYNATIATVRLHATAMEFNTLPGFCSASSESQHFTACKGSISTALRKTCNATIYAYIKAQYKFQRAFTTACVNMPCCKVLHATSSLQRKPTKMKSTPALTAVGGLSKLHSNKGV